MSDLKTRLIEDFKQAMLAKDQVRKDCIQFCRAAVLQVEKDKQIVLDDAGIIEVLNKEWKKKQDAIVLAGDSRPDFVEKIKQEMSIIESYLPKKLSKEEVAIVVREQVAKLEISSKKQIGLLMKTLMPLLKDKADGRLIQEVISEILE